MKLLIVFTVYLGVLTSLRCTREIKRPPLCYRRQDSRHWVAHSVRDGEQVHRSHDPQQGSAGGGLSKHEVDSAGVSASITSEKSAMKRHLLVIFVIVVLER